MTLIKGRYWVVLGMFLLTLLLYIDRICISVAKEPIGTNLGLSDKAMGWILSAFALGYALFQVPSGMLADRFGPRKVLTGIVTLWSLLTAATGAVWNFISLLAVRFAFGAGEAGAFPSLSRAIYSWIPLNERGIVIGLNFSGSRLGAAFALPMVAWLIEALDWRLAFLVLGIIGVIWAILWWWLFRDNPEEHSLMRPEEVSYITKERQHSSHEDHKGALNWSLMWKSRNMWSAIGQYFCSNFTFFFALTWLFPYLQQKYDLAAMEAGWYAVLPFLAGAAGNWISGGLVDKIFRQDKWNRSRVLPAVVGFLLAAAGLILSLYMDTAIGAVAMLSLAILGADMTLPPSWALCVDIGRENAGTVSGTMNMAGNLGSFLTALAFPYITDWTGSVDYFFYTAAFLNVMGVMLWLRVKANAGLSY